MNIYFKINLKNFEQMSNLTTTGFKYLKKKFLNIDIDLDYTFKLEFYV